MIAAVKRVTDEARLTGMKPSWRTGDWSALGPMLLIALWIYVTLTYLWDSADGARLGCLILLSVAFGVGLGQLPPVRFLLGRHQPDGAQAASTDVSRTGGSDGRT